MIYLTILTVLGAAVFLLILPFVSGPAGRRTPARLALPRKDLGTRRRELREEKASLLMALRELDFDYETGKLSAADYKGLRERYEGQAVQTLKELERADEEWSRVRAEIDGRLAEKFRTPAAGAAPACAACGLPSDPAHKFCASCGSPQTAAAHV